MTTPLPSGTPLSFEEKLQQTTDQLNELAKAAPADKDLSQLKKDRDQLANELDSLDEAYRKVRDNGNARLRNLDREIKELNRTSRAGSRRSSTRTAGSRRIR
jgi:predicted  nucleic acid-binding Zn-ribbon protein